MKRIRIATRASRLALAQTRQVINALRSVFPDLSVLVAEISTQGDRDKSDFLYARSSVGFFTSEVENALLDGGAELAVHSLKDLPTAMTKGLVIAAIPRRDAVNDVIVTSKKISSLNKLPAGAAIGTSSLRRMTQLKLLRSDLDCRPLRGNVETRIRKVKEGLLDAVIVAQAGLNRLGLSNFNGLILPPEEFIPAPGQGALAVQTRQDDAELCRMISMLDDPNTRLAVQTERRILAGLHGGCSIPLGVYAPVQNGTMHIHAILCNPSATRHIKKTLTCPADKADEAADRLIEEILKEGHDILDDIRRHKARQTDNSY